MASSSSANKVARVAARSGGGSQAKKRANWLFPAAIVVIVALGVAIVAFARNENQGTAGNTTPPRAQLSQGSAYDHWHNAFAISVCGKELTPPTDVQEDLLGIHTHGDGLIHIHPFSLRSAGKRATLKRFFDQIGLKVTDTGFSTADGKVYQAGKTECAGKKTEVVLAHWKDATKATSTPPDKVFTKDFGSVRLSEDGGAFTLALIPVGTEDEIPAPSAAAEIESLGAVDGGSGSSDAPTQGDETPTTASADVTDDTAPETTATSDTTATTATTTATTAAGG